MPLHSIVNFDMFINAESIVQFLSRFDVIRGILNTSYQD